MTSPSDVTYRQRILKVQLFIQEHLDEDLPLERLARLAHFSPYHFHRIFRGMVGESLADYVRRLRLESAAQALKHTVRGVTRIALDAGYGTHEAFTRAFRQRFGVSPSEYRAGLRGEEHKDEVVTMSDNGKTYEVRVEALPARRVAFQRWVGPYDQVGSVFERLLGWAGSRGLLGPATMVLGICHDDPEVTAADKLRCDCAVTVGDAFRGEGDIGVQTVEGGDHAILRHRGPYPGLKDAYRWLFGTWLPTSGREPRDAPPFEVYLNSCNAVKPEELLTDICLPLQAKSRP